MPFKIPPLKVLVDRYHWLIPSIVAALVIISAFVTDAKLASDEAYAQISSKHVATAQYWMDNVSTPLLKIRSEIEAGIRPSNCQLDDVHMAHTQSAAYLHDSFDAFYRKPGWPKSAFSIWLGNLYLERAQEEVIQAALLVDHLESDCIAQ